MGCVSLPVASSAPCTFSLLLVPDSNCTVIPGSMVSVAPGETVSPALHTTYGLPGSSQVVSELITPHTLVLLVSARAGNWLAIKSNPSVNRE
jgi:hypothetical protein